MGIKKNILYTIILTTSNYIFPLIVYPYVSRVLGVENIGLCNFIDSVINYFILFSMMGITIIGTRQIAIEKSNDSGLGKTFSSLMTLNGLTTLIAIIALIPVTLCVPELYLNKEMMLYGGLKILSNYFLLEWFYKGLEDFKFITIRTIFVKILYVISVFIFVKTRGDYKVYYLLTVLMISLNAIINTSYSRKFAKFKFKWIQLKSYVKSYLILGLYFFLNSLFTTFNIVYLGFACNDTQVGYYTTATKLYSILLALYTGVTTVLMPRMSNLLAQNKMDEFRNLLSKSISILFTFSIPLIIFTTIFAPYIVYLISGPGYDGAITPMRIIMPLMLLIGYEQVQVVQCLMPLKKDRAVMLNAGAGALVGITLNLLIVPHLESIGSAITWIAAETTILILSQIILTVNFKIRFPWKTFCKSLISNIPLTIILLLIYYFISPLGFWPTISLGFCAAILSFVILQIWIFKNSTILSLLDGLKSRFA